MDLFIPSTEQRKRKNPFLEKPGHSWADTKNRLDGDFSPCQLCFSFSFFQTKQKKINSFRPFSFLAKKKNVEAREDPA